MDEFTQDRLDAMSIMVDALKDKISALDFKCEVLFERANKKIDAQRPITYKHCYCNDHTSLQMVSGGGASEGYLGRVTLLIDGKYQDYWRSPVPARKQL